MEAASILNSSFSVYLHEDILHFQFVILRLPVWAQSPLSILNSQTASARAVSILSLLFSDFPHEVSLHSQFAILRLPTWSQSPFSIRHSQTAHMKTVSILNSSFSDLDMKIVSLLISLFSDFLHEDSLHSQFTVLRMRTWSQSPFSIHHSQTSTWR